MSNINIINNHSMHPGWQKNDSPISKERISILSHNLQYILKGITGLVDPPPSPSLLFLSPLLKTYKNFERPILFKMVKRLKSKPPTMPYTPNPQDKDCKLWPYIVNTGRSKCMFIELSFSDLQGIKLNLSVC